MALLACADPGSLAPLDQLADTAHTLAPVAVHTGASTPELREAKGSRGMALGLDTGWVVFSPPKRGWAEEEEVWVRIDGGQISVGFDTVQTLSEQEILGVFEVSTSTQVRRVDNGRPLWVARETDGTLTLGMETTGCVTPLAECSTRMGQGLVRTAECTLSDPEYTLSGTLRLWVGPEGGRLWMEGTASGSAVRESCTALAEDLDCSAAPSVQDLFVAGAFVPQAAIPWCGES